MSDLKLTPYWWESAPLENALSVEVPASADVCIVGAGLLGCLRLCTWPGLGVRSLFLILSVPAKGPQLVMAALLAAI